MTIPYPVYVLIGILLLAIYYIYKNRQDPPDENPPKPKLTTGEVPYKGIDSREF